MKYTKKMILVDFDKNPNLKPADGDVFDLTTALKTAEQPVVQKVTMESVERVDLDNAISAVLENNQLSDSDKIKYYNDLLRRFRLTKDTGINDREKQNEKLLRRVLEGVNVDARKRPASPRNEMNPPPPNEMAPPPPPPLRQQPSRKKPKKTAASQPRASGESSDSSWSTDALRREAKKKFVIQPFIKQIFPDHQFSDEEETSDSGGSQFKTPHQSGADDDDDEFTPPSYTYRSLSGRGYISSWDVLKR